MRTIQYWAVRAGKSQEDVGLVWVKMRKTQREQIESAIPD